MITLWGATAYLLKMGKYKYGSLITAIPATFMSAVTFTYILLAKEGLKLPILPSYLIGLCIAIIMLGVYLYFFYKIHLKNKDKNQSEGD